MSLTFADPVPGGRLAAEGAVYRQLAQLLSSTEGPVAPLPGSELRLSGSIPFWSLRDVPEGETPPYDFHYLSLLYSASGEEALPVAFAEIRERQGSYGLVALGTSTREADGADRFARRIEIALLEAERRSRGRDGVATLISIPASYRVLVSLRIEEEPLEGKGGAEVERYHFSLGEPRGDDDGSGFTELATDDALALLPESLHAVVMGG